MVLYTKSLEKGTEYVEVKCIIRSQDIDNRIIIARPLQLEDNIYQEVECKFPSNISLEQIPNCLNKIVRITGFLGNNKPIRLEIDDVVIDK